MGSLFPSSTFPLSYASDDMWKQPESNRCLLMSQVSNIHCKCNFHEQLLQILMYC